MALGLVEGDAKYGGYNWRVAGARMSIYLAATARHWLRLLDGEWEDPLTHVPHPASILADTAILVDAKETGKLVDDRPPKGNVPEILARFEEIVKHLHELYPNGPERCTEENKNEPVNRDQG